MYTIIEHYEKQLLKKPGRSRRVAYLATCIDYTATVPQAWELACFAGSDLVDALKLLYMYIGWLIDIND